MFVTRAIVAFAIFNVTIGAQSQCKCTLNNQCSVDLSCVKGICVDPCSGKKCGESALCTVENHKAECNCIPGYSGNPLQICRPDNDNTRETLRCSTCQDNNPVSTCRLGGDLIIDPDDQCKSGKNTCYRLKFLRLSDNEEIYQRGCDTANFCSKQRQRQDISIRRCDTCNEYYCNRGSLA